MLGVDAPVSLELLRQIVLGIVVNTIVALPMWALVRALRSRARCPRIRAGAGAGAPTRPAGSARSRAHERDRAASGRREPRMPVSPQLALRVAILGGIAMVMFGVIFFRLWYLQILTGEQYVQQADANRVRDLPIPAPRGEILDRNGQPIVAEPHRPTPCRSCPRRCRPRARRGCALYDRLGRLLGMSPAPHRGARDRGSHRSAATRPVTIKTDAGPGVLTVLAERPANSPGSSSSRLDPRLPATATWPRRCSATSARSPNRSSS